MSFILVLIMGRHDVKGHAIKDQIDRVRALKEFITISSLIARWMILKFGCIS